MWLADSWKRLEIMHRFFCTVTVGTHNPLPTWVLMLRQIFNLDQSLWQLQALSHSHVQYLYWTATWLEIRQREMKEGKEKPGKRGRKVIQIGLFQVTVSRHKHQSLFCRLTLHTHFLSSLSSASPHLIPFHPHLILHLWDSAANISSFQCNHFIFHRCPSENAHHFLTFTVIQS